jgi:hypothetical protein
MKNTNEKNTNSFYSYDYLKLPSNRFVCLFEDNNSRREEFEVLFSRFSQVKWSHMVTITFSRPVTDHIIVERFCSEYRKRLIKYLYGVSKGFDQIKILPFIESHSGIIKGKKKYHVHILVTNPGVVRKEVSRYDFMYKDRNQHFQYILKEVLTRMGTSEFVKKRCPVGDQYDVTPIDNTIGIVGYCLKEYRSGQPGIGCGWEGVNNISWS